MSVENSNFSSDTPRPAFESNINNINGQFWSIVDPEDYTGRFYELVGPLEVDLPDDLSEVTRAAQVTKMVEVFSDGIFLDEAVIIDSPDRFDSNYGEI